MLRQGSVGGGDRIVALGFVVLFIADHFLRPIMIGGATKLPFLWVLLGILGGVETLGLLGLFLGPAIMAALVLLWREVMPPRDDTPSQVGNYRYEVLAATGNPRDFGGNLGVDDRRQIGVEPFLEHRAQQLADQILDLAVAARTRLGDASSPARRASDGWRVAASSDSSASSDSVSSTAIGSVNSRMSGLSSAASVSAGCSRAARGARAFGVGTAASPSSEMMRRIDARISSIDGSLLRSPMIMVIA